MSAYLMSNQWVVLEFTKDGESSPQSYRGLNSYILSLPLKYRVTKLETHREVFELNADIYFKSQLVGRAISTEPFHARNLGREYQGKIRFELMLNHQDIAAIERLRNGSDIEFEIKFQGKAFAEGKQDKIEIYDNANLRYNIEQSNWLKILNDWKYSENFLIEIHKPQADVDLQDAFKYLKNAQELFNAGKWEHSVAVCRKALDNIASKRKITRENLGNLLANKKHNSLSERIDILIIALLQICHPAAHGDENAMSITWSRQDAEMVLLKTVAIFSGLSKI